MDVTLLKQPYEISFTGNPMPFVLAITPYGALQQSQDIKLQVKVLVEDVYGSGSGIFKEVRSQVFIPNNNGMITLDVASILAPYIDFYTPKMALSKPLVLSGHRKQYKIAWLLTVDNVLAVPLAESAVLIALRGSLSKESWHPSEFFTVAVLQNKLPLLFIADERFAMTEQRFMYWLYPYNNASPQTVSFTITYEDDSTEDFILNSTGIVADKWQMCIAPIGPNILQVRAVAKGLLIVKYTVTVTNATNVIIVEVPDVTVEHRNFYNTSQLFYRNSLGAMETLTLRGQTDFEADYDRQQAQHIVPPTYLHNAMLQAETVQTSIYETAKYTGFTGFLKKNAADKLRDIFLTKDIFIADDGLLKPIAIAAKNTKFFNNKDKFIGVQIDWFIAMQNTAYTPKGLMPVTRTCPAVDNFVVKQLNKTTLQILYALPIPYNKINVQIISSGVTKSYNYTGNTCTLKQAFDNPATGGTTATIQVKARLICDEDADPMDVGAFTTLNVSVSGASTLVAQPDSFTISNGFNTAITLPGTVLANDTDPDGNAIEVVAATGSTAQSGTFIINAAGVIQYTPPSSSFVGNDSFTYAIRRVGTTTPTVTTTVTIGVGSNSGAVYVKLVRRNETYYSNGYETYYTADMYLEFYKNTFATIPVDVTGLGLNIDVTKLTHTQDNSGHTNDTSSTVTNAAVGTEINVGSISNVDQYDPMWVFNNITADDFVVSPGAGYVLI